VKKISEEDIQKAVDNARASLEIDGMFIDDETVEMMKKKSRGEITHEQYIEYSLKKAKKAKKNQMC